ncbi:MAG: PP2C family protein-serine/threonine phosphatase [Gemmatimonadaceae bacterium]
MTSTGSVSLPSDAGRHPADTELDVFGLTHPGRVRTNNEDHFLVCALQKRMEVYHTSLPHLSNLAGVERLAFISMVADGVGGAAAGEEASRMALEGVTRYVSQALHCYYTSDVSNDAGFMQALEDAALKVHNELAAAATEDITLRGMATTLTLWIGVWPAAYLLQVGDSRCYVLSKGDLIQISRDQTVAQELVDRGVFTTDDAAHSGLAHILSSAIGGPQAAPVVRRLQQAWDAIGLVCSDGLTRHVSDDRIRERLASMTSARQACEALLQDALDGGGKDNITIIVSRVVPRTRT